MRKLVQTLLLSSVCLTTSCASIFEGTNEEVTFVSNPTGATVVAGEVTGTTPCTLNISKSLDTVTFTHASYPGREVELDSSLSWGYIVLDILFTPGYGAVGLIVDGITQAWWDHPDLVEVDFTKPPKEGETVAGKEEGPDPST